ncbi:MAG: hypothetical protein ABRQ23_08885 [Syntrophomonadaceae bacterium]
MDRIEADEALVGRTEARLREDLPASNNPRMRTKRGRNYQMKKFAIAACMAVMLIGGGFVYATPTSYVSVDINPSVELAVNALGRVVDIQANDDGEAILEGLDLENMKVDKAVSLIVDAAAEQGFLEEDGTSIVSITVATDDQETADELTEDAEEGAKEALEKNEVAAEVSQAAISIARRDAAWEAGISPGKMNLYQKLWAAENPDEALTAEDYDEIMAFAEDFADDRFEGKAPADVPVKSIMKAIKEARGDDGEDADSDDDADDVDKPGKGKANAPGQILKAGSSDAEDQAWYLPNGKIKKNTPADDEEEED